MVTTIIGTKQEMTSKFNELGKIIPVTAIVAEPNFIVKGTDKIQIAAGKSKKIKKPQNHFVTAIGFAPKMVREIKLQKKEGQEEIKTGDQIKVSIFEVGDIVKVTGTTKGHGFAGGIKRHGFHGGPKTHGQSDRHRAPGSIGKGTTPGRVFKGKKMAGHYGNVQFTVTGLEVVSVIDSENTILVKGAVPGWQNGMVIVEKTGKVKKHVPLYDKSKVAKSEETQVTKEPEETKAEDSENQNVSGAESQNMSIPDDQAESINEQTENGQKDKSEESQNKPKDQEIPETKEEPKDAAE